MKRIFLVGLVLVLCLCGCSNGDENINGDGTITYKYAKELIINESAMLVDVRTQEEYDENHIDGAVLMPVDKIDEDFAFDNIGNKEAIVIVYCRSGARSSQAASKLKDLGYNNVYDLGSIENWEE